MIDLYRKGWRLLDRTERRRLVVLAALIVCAGFAEIFALSSVSLLVPLLIAPETVHKYAILQRSIDWLGYPDPRSAFPPIAFGASLLIALSLWFSYATSMASLRFGNEVARRIASQGFCDSLHAPYAWHLRQSASVLAQRCFNDPEKIGKGFFPAVLDQAYSVVLLCVGVAFLLMASPWHNLTAILVLGVVGAAIVTLLKPRIAQASSDARDGTLELSRLSVEAFSAVKDIQVRMSQHPFTSGFLRLFGTVNGAQEHVAALQKISHSLLTGMGQIGIIAIAMLMLSLNARPDEIATHLALLLLVLSRVLPAMSRTVASLNSLSSMRPYLDGVFQLSEDLRQGGGARSSNETDTRPDVPPDWKQLEFSQTGYRYSGGGALALTGLELILQRGCCYGVVGPSGAGKSTLSDIVLGLLDPSEGCFGPDGVSLVSYSRESWLSRVGYVPQSPFIFNDTLRRNVALGIADERIDDERVSEAIAQADLQDVVDGLEHGLDTEMGDRGARLSGGQRQRLAIARALYQRPDVLVLDEATSALDAISERKLIATIESLRGKMTILIVAHRLQVIAACDSILLFEGGRLRDSGAFSELVGRNQLFSEMVRSARIAGAHI